MSFKLVETTVGSAVATDGTFTFPYPTNTNAGSFAAFGHKLFVDKFQSYLNAPADFTVAFGASEITVTYLGATSIPSGARVNAEFNVGGDDDGVVDTDFTDNVVERVTPAAAVVLNLGAPDTADADGVCASQAITAAGTGTIAGALASGGVATFDVPRNVVAAWTNTAVLTVTGTDEYGKTVVESSASGTSFAGKKAFKTITSVDVSADVTGATVGTGDVLGLPAFVSDGALVIAELEDGAAATAGTIVGGDSAKATATTGDVRGTYDANSAANGARVFDLVIIQTDPKYKGVAQYAG
jgi:hypothetical protein